MANKKDARDCFINVLFTLSARPVQARSNVAVNGRSFGSDTDVSFLATSWSVFGATVKVFWLIRQGNKVCGPVGL